MVTKDKYKNKKSLRQQGYHEEQNATTDSNNANSAGNDATHFREKEAKRSSISLQRRQEENPMIVEAIPTSNSATHFREKEAKRSLVSGQHRQLQQIAHPKEVDVPNRYPFHPHSFVPSSAGDIESGGGTEVGAIPFTSSTTRRDAKTRKYGYFVPAFFRRARRSVESPPGSRKMRGLGKNRPSNTASPATAAEDEHEVAMILSLSDESVANTTQPGINDEALDVDTESGEEEGTIHYFSNESAAPTTQLGINDEVLDVDAESDEEPGTTSQPNIDGDASGVDPVNPTSATPSPPSDDELVVAQPVTDTSDQDLPTAQTFDVHQKDTNHARRRKDIVRSLFLEVMGFLLVVGVVVLVVFLVRGFPKGDTAASVSQDNFTDVSNAITLVPTELTEETYILSILPNFTIAALEDLESPQYRAYQWLLEDQPLARNFSSAKAMRRFTLACIYYSTDGEHWTFNDNWLNHSLHEMLWYNSIFSKMNGLENLTDSQLDNQIGYRHLGLLANGLVGSIPDELYVGLPDLDSIHLSTNELTGTISSLIGKLTNLQMGIALQANFLTGSIPTEISLLSNLTILMLNVNQLTGTLPAPPPGLEMLFVDKNLLSGTITSDLGFLKSLTLLQLNQNDFTGSIPSQVGNLDSLELFSLAENSCSGSVPSELGLLSNMTFLSLFDNGLSGTIPSQLGALSKLSHLSLESNLFSGAIPSELGLLSSLVELFLFRYPSMTGTLPTELGKLGMAQYFFVGEMPQVNGPIPSEYGQLSELRLAFLDAMNLTYSIPTELGLPRNHLTQLLLYHNALRGTIPTELSLLDELTVLRVDSNALSGSLPTELGNIVGMETFTASQNQITGSIPSQFSQWYSLVTFDAFDNRLSGPIDAAIGQSQSLLEIWNITSNDLLSGTIPEALCSLGTSGLGFDCSDNLCGCHCICPS